MSMKLRHREIVELPKDLNNFDWLNESWRNFLTPSKFDFVLPRITVNSPANDHSRMKTSRRAFIKKGTASLAMLSLMSDSLFAMQKGKELTGVQLYSIRDDMK